MARFPRQPEIAKPMDVFLILVHKLADLLTSQLPWAIGLAALFTVVSLFPSQACNPGQVWWKNPGLLTDTHYLFIIPVLMPYLRTALVVLVVALASGVTSAADVEDFLTKGRGPLSTLHPVAQGAIYMLGTDFMLYWAHRIFHGRNLWPFHAVHHSAEHVDWTTSYRNHPVNNLLGASLTQMTMVALGISPEVMVALVPFDILTAAWVHSNLNWTLGPLKYVFATPVFHRWHHGPVHLGGEKNFAPTFSFWDYMFGTFYMPEGELPEEYGVDDPDFPKDFIGQMVVPFRQFIQTFQRPKPKADSPGPAE
ncbi:sterol desaturase family protein [Phreatobacter aquaticus]|uniref:sterol desaturase family protein n=1 Tax=Phreatobacter aquaticus TaxID=2570229 RepID=UPI00143DED3A|nr:sterol desaturase family protein [Phreatobacter aquaticus]